MRPTRIAPPQLAAAAVAALVATALLARGAGADDVYLTNGKSFDGVIAHADDARVRIELPYGGEITLPMSRVERIERSESPFERYLARKHDLEGRSDAGVADWVDLARRAQREKFQHGFRDAALAAARLDPHAPEVAPLMRALGYALDERLDEWVPKDEALRRNGLVPFRGAWVTAEERERRLRDEQEEARDRAERRRLDRLAAAVEAVAELELVRTVARSTPPAPALPVAYPIVFWPGTFFVPGPLAASPPAGAEPPEPPRRPPTAAPGARRGSFDNPFGGGLGPPELTPGRLNPEASPPPGRLFSGGR